jgi:hypothetical protein
MDILKDTGLLENKQAYLSNVTDVLLKKLKNDEVTLTLTFDVEDIVRDYISLFESILQRDKIHHVEATKHPSSYPYEKRQKAMEQLIKDTVKGANLVLDICAKLEEKGCEINKKNKEKLQRFKAAFENIEERFERFYKSPAFQEFLAEAIKEYESGKTEEWP